MLGSSCKSFFLVSFTLLTFVHPSNRTRNQRNQNEAEKKIITVRELPYTEIVKSVTVGLASVHHVAELGVFPHFGFGSAL